MNIIVFDVPAENGGALSILKNVYEEAVAHTDKSIKWIFVLSKPYFPNTKEVQIVRYPWIKKSWFHRYFFDNIIAPKLTKKFEANLILSLQNIIIPRVYIKQILYVHQSLPFVEYEYSIFENKKFWIYQKIIGKKIIKSIKKADQVIVQTSWMKKACMKKAKVDSKKINVIPPQLNLEIKKPLISQVTKMKTFFYPANAMEYKNHKVIIEACEELKKDYSNMFKVIFTLKGNESEYIKKIFIEVKKKELPIVFIGHIPQEKVFQLYLKCILLFPSFIETFGLPLLEARVHKSIIFASKSPYAKEVLDGYSNSYFFDPHNNKELFKLMEAAINGKIMKNDVNNQEYSIDNKSSILSCLFNEYTS